MADILNLISDAERLEFRRTFLLRVLPTSATAFSPTRRPRTSRLSISALLRARPSL